MLPTRSGTEDTALPAASPGPAPCPRGATPTALGSYTQALNTTCGRALGHGGHFPGYYELPISSHNGSHQAVLLVDAPRA